MDSVFVGECTVPVTEAQTSVDLLGCSTLFHFPKPTAMTSLSVWFRATAADPGAQWLLYDTRTSNWQLRASALVTTTYQNNRTDWTTGAFPGFSVWQGTNQMLTLRVAWYSGIYDPLQDPANPSFVPATNCAYGSQKQASAQAKLYLDPAAIDLILTTRGFSAFAILFSALWFTIFDVEDLCSELPPPLPPPDANLLNLSLPQLQNLFRTLSWLYFCECKPGTPSPVPPPAPIVSLPPDTPTPPVIPCSNIDPCGALITITQQLRALQQTLLPVRDLVTATQRYAVPFGYVAGTQHLNLTGSGSIPISRLLGFQVTIQGLPPDSTIIPSNPAYVWDVGWMSVSDGAGMLQQRRIARQSHTWLPPYCQDAITFGYFLQPGCSISVVELQPEP